MKITIESTDRIVLVNEGIQCRIWEGETSTGIKVQCLIPRIAAQKDQDLSQFEAELQEQQPPSVGFDPWPLRMIL